jgi:hypothetical protein
MDSNIYRYFIEEIRTEKNNDLSSLPIFFLKAPFRINEESFKNVCFFLMTTFQSLHESSEKKQRFTFLKDNFFEVLFLKAQTALIDIINGNNADCHPFRANGFQLIKFLTFSANNGIPHGFIDANPLFLAMMSCILEGMMYCGWCPDAFEGSAKRAAHEYCVSAKKSLHHVQNDEVSAIVGYFWAAWLFAQKTEGIRVTRKTSPSIQTFEWNIDSFKGACIVENSNKPPLFFLLLKCHTRIPHPIKNPSLDGMIGLFLFIENEPLLPVELVEYSEIARVKKHGHSFCYRCETASIKGFSWTIVFIVFNETFYRIDVLKLPNTFENLTIKANLNLENQTPLKKTGENAYSGIAQENIKIELIDNPLELEFDSQLENGISRFSSKQKRICNEKPLTIVTAWAQGKGVVEISRTHLLGIYD